MSPNDLINYGASPHVQTDRIKQEIDHVELSPNMGYSTVNPKRHERSAAALNQESTIKDENAGIDGISSSHINELDQIENNISNMTDV